MASPLADRLRPKEIEEVVGQKHLLGEGKVLRRIIESGQIPNMIFFGPSGIGKTTVAGIIAEKANMRLHKLNGTSASVADIKAVIGEVNTFAGFQGILLYLDEIQYLNKKQQQSLLEYIENGQITLIASTTENPYFYIYNAVLSRCTVFEFKPVEPEEVKKAVKRAFSVLQKEQNAEIVYDEEVVDSIASLCGGDVRKALNAAELAVLSAVSENGKKRIVSGDIKDVAQKSAMRFDRDADEHYDALSALQKSVRGSDPDAAIYYLAKILSGGDLLSACRRLLVTASEDIGLAYPQGVSIVKSCVDAALQLGLPEARIPLAQAAILLATAPKSNSAICAIDAAMEDIQNGQNFSAPDYLRDAHYQGAAKLGRGLTYQYPHSFENNYVKQQYLPDQLSGKKYYESGNNKTEKAAQQYWDKIKGFE